MQHSYNITAADAKGGLAFRAAVNAALQALVSNNLGESAATTLYEGMWQWFEGGSTWTLKAYTGVEGYEWVTILTIDTSTGTLTFEGLADFLLDDFAEYSEKAIPADDDTILINDSEDEGAVKRITKSSLSTPAALASYRDLVVANNSSNPTYQVDVAAAAIVLEDSSGNAKRFGTLAETVDITASGANGLDTGSEAASTWYHIWAIGKSDGTLDALVSTSSTAPTLPEGYTYKGYLGAVYNNGSSNIITFHQYNNDVSIMETGVLAGGTQSSYTSVSLAAAVPPTAKTVTGFLSAVGGASTAPAAYLAATSAGISAMTVQSNAANNSTFTAFITMKLVEAQTVYYKNLATGGSVYLYVSQFSY